MWQTHKLSEICVFENGDRGKNYPSKKHQCEKGIPFINAGDLSKDGNILDHGMAYITEERYDLLGAGKIEIGDVLFCLRGSLGKCALNTSFKKGAIASSLVILRPKRKFILPEFLLLYLKSPLIEKLIKNTASGTAQPNLSAKVVSEYEMKIPSVEEQQRIVAKLDAAFAEIDSAASSTERCIEFSNKFFTQKVLNTFNEVIDKSVLKNIDDVCSSMHQGLNSQGEKIRFVDNGVALLQTRNIRLGTIDKDKQLNFLPDYCWEKFSKKYAPKTGDVLFTNRGTIGKLAQVSEDYKALIHWNIFKLSPDINLVTPAFMFRTLDYLNKSKYFKNMQTGTTVGFVSTKMMKEAPIHLPKIEEQEKICGELKAMEILNKKYISICETKLESLTHLKQSILAKELQNEAA